MPLRIQTLYKIALIFLLLFSPISSYADNHYHNIKLSNNINFKLSKEWQIIDLKKRQILDKKVYELNQIKISSSLPFAANFYKNRRVIGIMNIRIYPKSEIYQNEIRKMSKNDLSFYDNEIYKNVKRGVTQVGAKILHWKGSNLEQINNRMYLVSNYTRTSINRTKSIFNVSLYRLLDGYKSFTLTLSYDAKMKNYMLSKIKEIAQSINY